MRILFAFLLLCVSWPAAAQTQPAPQTVLPTVIGSGTSVEGDQISVNGQVVRLWGIDAPDLEQTCTNKLRRKYPCGTVAKERLQGFIGQNQVTCHIRGNDRFGQQIGTCGVNGLDLAALMVRSGWALAYQSLTSQYTVLEAQAQAASRGAWAGYIEAPWEWRTKQKKKP